MKIFYTGQMTESGKKEGVISFSDDDLKFYPLDQAEKKLGHKIKYIQGYVAYGQNTESGYLYNYDEIPCGHCLGCRLDHAKEWSNRIEMELAKHPYNNWFLTITYDEEHVPLSVSKRDVQLFIKKVRKLAPLRYFLASEYGPRTLRPHYHMILLNHNIGKAKRWDKQLVECLDLEKIWGKGRILGAEANSATVAYTTAYTVKKAYELDKDWPSWMEKPFILMSRRPGLGSEFIETKLDETSEEGKIYINGRKRMPRYMKNKLEKKDPEKLKAIQDANKRTAEQYHNQDMSQFATKRATIINNYKEQAAKAKRQRERRDKN